MKSEDHHDIIKQMADRLREHSVPYQEGAWERFKEMEKKKSMHIVLWPYLSAAAVILIAIVLFLNPSPQTIVTSEFAEHSIDKREHKEEGNVKEPEETNLEVSVIDKESVLKANMVNKNRELAFASDAAITKANLSDNGIHDGMKVNLIKVEEITTSRNEDFLSALSTIKEDENFHVNKVMAKKWSVGLDVSPNMGSNQQVNMGGGVYFAYSVSPKVSISSGISYLQVGSESMPSFSYSNSPAVFSPRLDGPSLDLSSPVVTSLGGRSQTKTLHKIEANVVGLDIPFSINYHVNKRLFASAGFSVFNVLNEGRMSQFENRVVDVVYLGADIKTPEPVVHTFFSKEMISEKNYEGRNLNGFFNFSVGYSIPVSEKVGLSIEPFFKIQMNNLIEEDMNLSNGGVKISTRF